MSQTLTGKVVRSKIDTHLTRLRQNRAAKTELWDKEKVELWKQCIHSGERLAAILENALKTLNPFLKRTDVKDELFRFFLGNGYRIGKYILLPIFSTAEDKDDLTTEKSKVLAFSWNIRTAETCFMMIVNTSDNGGRGEAVYKNFFSADEILRTKEEFINSVMDEKELLQEIIKEWNGYHLKFIELLNRSQILESEEKFLDRIITLYSEELTKPEVRSLVFSKRSRRVLNCGKGDLEDCNSYILGDNLPAERNINKLTETLLDLGYPDKQKIIIDMQTELNFEGEEYPEKLDKKDVGFTRDNAAEWNNNEVKNMLKDEYNHYSHHPIHKD